MLRRGKNSKSANLYFENLSESENEQLRRSIGSTEVPLSSQAVEEKLMHALDEFERMSFPFIRFEASSIRIDSISAYPSFALYYKTLKGPKLIIREIQVAGNELTKKKVINATKFESGRRYF